MQSAVGDRNPSIAPRPVISRLRGYQCWLFLLGLVLVWPYLLFGDVFVFNDTISYLRGADTLAQKLVGYQHPFFAPGQPADALSAASGGAPTDAGRKMVLYGRSIYFGMFLYPGLLFGFWLTVLLQALAAGGLIVALVRHFTDPARRPAFLAACIAAFVLVACTPLPFFVCFMMPDLAVGLALPAAVILLCGWHRERPAWRAGLVALCLFAALAHSTAVAVMALLALGALVLVAAFRARRLLRPAVIVLAVALAGVGGEATFGMVSRVTTGLNPVRPPFLTARLIEDGPARRFLAEHCDTAEFVLCRYPVREQVSAEVFLWAVTNPPGGFKALPVDDAVRVSHEQTRFALAVVKAYPAETALALAGNVFKLAGNLALEDFRPEFLASQMRADGQFSAFSPDDPLPPVNRVIRATTLVLLLATIGVLLWFVRTRTLPDRMPLVWTLVGALVLNDVICACLSGPFARYNTRVIWVLPLAALLLVLAARDDRNHPAAR